ncbi:MAG: hypothetical protein ACYDA2_08495 [Acidimicrobiales bacterium]
MSLLVDAARRAAWPRVAVLTARWTTADEGGWALRQVAGALAMAAEVHVLTPQGSVARGLLDGPFTVQETASACPPWLGHRRDLLAAALAGRGPLPEPARARADAVLAAGQEQWDAVAPHLEAVHPDLVVIADHRHSGVVQLVERVCPDVPAVVVPLAGRFAVPGEAHYTPLFERAGCALVFSSEEAALVAEARPELVVHEVGLPLAVNPSVLREPNTFTGEQRYVLVLSPDAWGAPGWATTLGGLLQVAFPDTSVVFATADRLVAFHRGFERQFPASGRGSDVLRLLAWADAVVDVRPGPLFARRSLESLLAGTPVVVPASSRARQHAEAGGGLWFEGAGDLAWCVEALVTDDLGATLGRQGRDHAASVCGPSFAAKVIDAVSAVVGETLPLPA